MDELQVRPVNTFSELIKAAELVHKKYVETRLMKPRPSGIRFFIRDLIAPALTFGVWEGNNLIGSASLNANLYCPLPGIQDYPREIAALNNCIVIESTKFACDDRASKRSRGLSRMSVPATLLLRALFQWCLFHKVEWWLLIVHPRVQSIYEENFGFIQLGSPAPCSVAENAPGVLLGLDIKKAWEQRRTMSIDARAWVIEGPEIFSPHAPVFSPSEEEIRALLQFDPFIVEESTLEERKILAKLYPKLGIAAGEFESELERA